MSVELKKPKRLPGQSIYAPPPSATLKNPELGLLSAHVMSVSAVAREWRISARRVRVMLMAGRLAGRQLENGYWQVFYPYRYVFGTRGPAIKRQREYVPPVSRKRERNEDWF